MSPPRLRYSVLALMALVAATAIGLHLWVGAMRSGRQALSYRAKAEEMFLVEQSHRNRAAGLHNAAMSHEVQIELKRERARDERDLRFVRRDLRLLEFGKEMVRYEDRLADHYRHLAVKYRDAADHPWEPIATDPSPPGPPPPEPDLNP